MSSDFPTFAEAGEENIRAHKSRATHFLEYNRERREYRPVPIPQYARD